MNEASSRVLLIEDNPGDVRLIQEMLHKASGNGFELECADCLAKGGVRLAAGGIDIVLLDLGLPDSQGLATYEKIQGIAPEAPTVIFSGQSDEEVALEAVRLGAQDYLLKKQVTPDILTRSLRYSIERKRSEVALRASQAELQEAQRVAHLGSWSSDVKTGLVTWSEELYRIMGLDSSKPAPPHPSQKRLFTRESWSRLSNAVNTTLREGLPYELELQILRADGSIGWVLARGEAVRDPGGAIFRLRGIVLDITERKQAELDLQQSETDFRALANAMPQLVWIATPDGLNTFFNQGWLDYTGLTFEESVAAGWLKSFHPNDKHLARDHWRHALANGSEYRMEGRLLAANGTYRWFLIRGVPQRDDCGNIVKWFGTCTDVDELEIELQTYNEELHALNEDLESRVKERTSELQTILDSAPVAIWMTTEPDARLTTGNIYAHEKVMRVPRGADISAASAQDNGAASYKLLRKGRELLAEEMPPQMAFATGKPVEEQELDLVFPDGRTVSLILSAVPLFNTDGKVRGVVATGADVTPLRKIEQALRESEERLSLALRASEEGVWDWNVETNAIWFSARCMEMLGYPEPPIEPNFESWVLKMHPDDRERVLRVTEEVLEGKREYETELRMRHKDGHYVPIFSRGFTTRREPDGPIVRIVGVHIDLTERKAAEAALRQSEARYRALVTTGSSAIYQMNSDWSEMLHLDGRQVLKDTLTPGRTWLDEYIDPEDQPRVMAAIEHAKKTKSMFELEHRVRRLDGTLGWILSRAVPLTDAQGLILEWFGAANDITARKTAEDSLRASEEKYRRLFENIEELVTVYEVKRDPDGRVVERRLREANPAFLSAMNVASLDEIRGRTSTEVFGKAASDALIPAVQKAMDTGQVQLQEVYRPESDRHYISSVTRLDADTYLGNSWDITAIKHAEQALRDSVQRERFLAEVLELSEQPFATEYADGRVGVCNRAYCDLTGYSREELQGASLKTVLTPPEWEEAKAAALAELDRTGKPVRYEKEYVKKNGQRVPVDLLVHTIRDSAGQVELYYSFVTDMSDRKKMEEALRKSRDELELRVQERTLQLSATNSSLAEQIEERKRADEALQESVRALESALREKTVLLKEVHHRVKNNLAVISSLLSLKADTTENAEVKSALENSQLRVRSIALVHEHLYGSSRLDRINFSDYAQELARRICSAVAGEPGQISIEMDVKPVEIGIERAVPCALILNELLSNAFRHAFPGGRKGRIRVSFREFRPGTLELRIDDDGIGLPSGRLTDQGGQSLGLRIIGILTRQLDGTIEQLPCSGTCIVLRFPANSSDEPRRSPAIA